MRVAGLIGLLAAAFLANFTSASLISGVSKAVERRYATPQTSEPLPKRMFWAEVNGYHSAGRLFETTIGDDGTPTHRELPYGAGVTHIGLSPSYMYWSHYNMNSSSEIPLYIGRASLDGSGSFDDKWVMLNSTEYGHLVYSTGLVWVESAQSILYQDQWTYNLIMVSEKKGQPTTLGNFGYQGNGGLNGGIWINGSSTRAIIGIDESESNNNYCGNGGLLALTDFLTQDSSDATPLLCDTVRFPRGVTPFPHSQQVLLCHLSMTWSVVDLQGSGNSSDLSAVVGDGMLSASGKTYVGVSPYVNSAGTSTFNVVDFYGAGDFNRGTIKVQPWFDIPVNSMNITCVACISSVHFEPDLTPRPTPAPTGSVMLTEVSPASGSVVGGYPVYLIGAGFSSNAGPMMCDFGYASSNATYLAPAVVRCDGVPASPLAGTVPVRLAFGSSGARTNAVDFTYVTQN